MEIVYAWMESEARRHTWTGARLASALAPHFTKGPIMKTTIRLIVCAVLAGLITYCVIPPAYAQRDGGRYSGQTEAMVVVAASDSPDADKNIADFQCSGTADEVEVNLAITQVNAAGGGIVRLPQGAYSFTSPALMRANVILEGVGISTIITMATDVQEIAITNQDRSGGNDNITLRNFQVNGNKENQNNTNGTSDDAFTDGAALYTEITGKYSSSNAAGLGTIDFRNSTGVTIENLYVQEGFPSCIDVAGCDEVMVSGCTVFNSGDDCIAINLASSNVTVTDNIVHDAGSGVFVQGQANNIEVQDGCFTVTVSKNALFDAAAAGVSVNSHTGAAVCHNVTVTGNAINECLYGVRVQGQSNAIQHDIVISSNSIEAQAVDSARGILCQWCTEVTITGNDFNIGDADTVAIGAQFSDTVTNVTFTGNMLTDALADADSQSIQFAASGTFTRFQIGTNVIDMAGTGIRPNDNSTLVDVDIQNNTVNAKRAIFCDTGVSWSGFLTNNTLKGTTTWFRDDDDSPEDSGTPAGVDANIIWYNNRTKGELFLSVKSVMKTINLDSSDDNDDFEFDDTQGNVTEQTRDMGAIIPAYAEVLSAQLRCFETVAGSGSAVMAIDLGTSSGGAEIFATADIDTANDISATEATGGPEIIATAAAKNVWINATPTANWSTLTAGRWAVIITYIDYGSVFTIESP